MANANTKLFRQLSDGVVFADPADSNYTVRFKTATSQKSLNGTTVENHISEVIVNDLHSVTIGTAVATDALSVRIRVSGGDVSKARLYEILLGIAGQLPTWVNENVFEGFAPVTVPVNPHA